MTPGLRKLALTTHVTSSVGWLGSVAAFLALAITGLRTHDAQMVRAAYLAMEVTTWFVIVPLAFASLLTGLVMSLGTQWGLFRHYWVLVKFVLTILATALLLLHTQAIGALAAVARDRIVSGPDVSRLQVQLVGDAIAALLALLVNVTLSVYKPRGLTAYGRRKQREPALDDDSDKNGRVSRWIQALAVLVVVLAVLVVVLHLTGHGLGGLHH